MPPNSPADKVGPSPAPLGGPGAIPSGRAAFSVPPRKLSFHSNGRRWALITNRSIRSAVSTAENIRVHRRSIRITSIGVNQLAGRYTSSRRSLYLFAVLLIAVGALGGQQIEPQNPSGEEGSGESGEVNPASPVNPELEELLAEALEYAERGEWDRALERLDEAERTAPNDERIASYRSSVKELRAVDAAQNAWAEGESVEVEREEDEEAVETAEKFVIDRSEERAGEDAAMGRSRLHGDLGIKFFVQDPIIRDMVNSWSSADEFFYSSVNLNVRYWLPFARRVFGLYFSSNGFSWRPARPSLVVNTLNLGIGFRGFLLESSSSRLELGIDFGAALYSEKTPASGEISRRIPLFLGLTISDPLFYHIFRADSLENLVFGAEVRFYTAARDQEFIENLSYRVDAAWRFNWAEAGVRLEWWDFVVSGVRRSPLSFSLFGGFRY